MLDLFFRAETPAALRTVVRSAPFRNVIGDVRDPDGPGFIMLPGSVDWVYFAPGSITITPGDPPTMDPWCWLHLRLTGVAEEADYENGEPEPNRWNKSRIRKWMENNGELKTIRDCRVYEHTLGNGKRIQIWHGADMAATMPPSIFHEYLGGNSY